MSPASPKMLGMGLSLMPSEVPSYTHVAISPRFPSLCAQLTNVESHLSSSRPPVMISEPGCRVPAAASEKQKCSGSCKGPRPCHFSASA